MDPGKFRERAAIDVLLKQYEFLRDEITRCIYLEHLAIIGLYTFLGSTLFILIGLNLKNILVGLTQSQINNSGSDEIVLVLFALIFVQVIICGFGSLFLKEQARNRRACSFLRAIEQILNEKIGEIGIYWENFIISDLVKLINDQYYKNRLLGVGLPVFLPNVTITSSIVLIFYSTYEKCCFFPLISVISLSISAVSALLASNSLTSKVEWVLSRFRKQLHIFLLICIISPVLLFLYLSGIFLLSYTEFEMGILSFSLFFPVSFSITFLWAFMIMNKTYTKLGEEELSSKEEVLNWLRKEQLRIALSRTSLAGVSSFFELNNCEVKMKIHVTRNELSEKIYDIEIFPDDQEPPWGSIVGLRGPKHWRFKKKGNGVRFFTEDHPLKKCEPAEFEFKVSPDEIVKDIRVHLTDDNSRNLGDIISQPISTFTLEDNVVEMEIRLMRHELDRKIYNIEIFPDDQKPSWKYVKGLEGPNGWTPEKTDKGVRFSTNDNPLRKYEPAKFKFRVQAKEISDYIRVHLTDKKRQSIGEIISIKKEKPW